MLSQNRRVETKNIIKNFFFVFQPVRTLLLSLRRCRLFKLAVDGFLSLLELNPSAIEEL